MTANPWRGEVELILDGTSYILRPTFLALCRIEEHLKTGLPVLAEKLAAGSMTLQELAIIITCCLTVPPPLLLEDSLLRCGIAYVIECVAAMLAMVFGGYDAT